MRSKRKVRIVLEVVVTSRTEAGHKQALEDLDRSPCVHGRWSHGWDDKGEERHYAVSPAKAVKTVKVRSK